MQITCAADMCDFTSILFHVNNLFKIVSPCDISDYEYTFDPNNDNLKCHIESLTDRRIFCDAIQFFAESKFCQNYVDSFSESFRQELLDEYVPIDLHDNYETAYMFYIAAMHAERA